MNSVDIIIEHIQDLSDAPISNLGPESPLVGAGKVIDSRGLVELCLKLEDLAESNGYEFDWTSENAMSSARSIFRSVESLAQYFDESKTKKV